MRVRTSSGSAQDRSDFLHRELLNLAKYERSGVEGVESLERLPDRAKCVLWLPPRRRTRLSRERQADRNSIEEHFERNSRKKWRLRWSELPRAEFVP